jgi:hypothetical protein
MFIIFGPFIALFLLIGYALYGLLLLAFMLASLLVQLIAGGTLVLAGKAGGRLSQRVYDEESAIARQANGITHTQELGARAELYPDHTIRVRARN